MGRGGSGVEVRETSIRLAFTWRGKAYRETITLAGKPVAPTNPNIKAAHRQIAQIRAEIAAGTFELRRHFPDSPRADTGSLDGTFGQAADAWLATRHTLAPATRDQYRNALAAWKRMLGADKPLSAITPDWLEAKIAAHPWPSAKLLNNALIPLRGVLGRHFRGAMAAANPALDVRNARVVRTLPDPLTLAERDAILADLLKHYDARVWAYFAWAFATGMRPEEIIALRWDDIDQRTGVARVQRVRTFRGAERDGTKTHAVRDVDLVPLALDALKVMKPHTAMLKRDDGDSADVFQNPVTRRAWHDERSQRDHYWRPALKRLGIRWRRPYCARHTYCTAALMAGVNPAYIAAQAGHSVKMLLDVYARWIPGQDGGAQRERLAAALIRPGIPLAAEGQKRESPENR